MHEGNRMFWARAAQKYQRYFVGSEVIECGSREHNGSIRDYFRASKKYIGVDWKPGGNVDRVSLIHDLTGTDQYDLVASASMLEHDPYWEKSLTRMAEMVKPDGALMVSWGAARNPQHCLDDAPDGGFHPLKAGLVLQKLDELGLYVHEFVYEMTLSNVASEIGCVALIAFKDPVQAVGEQSIAELEPEDVA